MPSYAYRCPRCGHEFEVERRITDPRTDVRCPKCGAVPERVIEQAGFVLRGPGWEKDGYG